MNTILGPFHPYLEDALVDKIGSYKREDPLCPILVLAPSEALRRRLKILLAKERNLSLVNLQLLTFHQLSLRLYAESHGTSPVMLRDDRFLEEVLRHLIRAREPGAEAFAGIEERAGGCAALWQTLRDLRDAKLEPEVSLEALREGRFGGKRFGQTADLLQLHQTLRDFCVRKQIMDQSDLDEVASAAAASSRFLAEFTQIFYYGFYDLTQVQLDFFSTVARNFPTTLFFPLLETQGHSAWSFAAYFYQRYIQGLSSTTATDRAEDTSSTLPTNFCLFDESGEQTYAAPPANWRVTITNTFGVADETSSVAKEILRLVADGTMKFHEIGVVARGLEDYGAEIKKIFNAHQIPMRGVIEEPLTQFPLTKTSILLLNLPAKDFPRSQVIEVLSSPHFRLDAAGSQGTAPRPDLWDLATRELAICKGVSEWRRLRNYQNRDLVLSQMGGDDETRQIRVGAEHMRALADLTDMLAADFAALPPKAPWSQYAGAWSRLFAKYLDIRDGKESPQPTTEQLVETRILEVLEQSAGLDAIDNAVTLSTFSETLQRWLERSSLAALPSDVPGVSVLSATAARGVSFRALFVLGMNEGLFPRTIREDAFLRDHEREILERDLGYKVNQKLAGFDEEKLLFTLLVGAARERLYCSFQRADDSGRALAPSWYLQELKRALGAGPHLTEITLPRSVAEKSNTAPFSRQDLLLPEELAVRLSIADEDPTPLLEATGLMPTLYKHGREAVALLDRCTARLHQFDGVIGPLPDHWQRFLSRGVSPTALETYARCPFQFFARHVLRLEPLDLPEESMGPSAGEFGELGHEILKLFYLTLPRDDRFKMAGSPMDTTTTIQAIAQRVFADYETNHPVGYPILWAHVKETLTGLIDQVVAADLGELSASGYVPIAFEVDRKGELSADWPEPLRGVKIHGRLDRIDGNVAKNRRRIIDYKFKFGAQPSPQDKNLYRAAVRGQKLQPPIYCLLETQADTEGSRSQPVDIEANFYYIAPRWRNGPLVTESFRADGFSGPLGAEVKRTIVYLLGAIRAGRFFIQRGDYCAHCDVAEICRKNHPPSLWRAENDTSTAPHRDLRRKDASKP